jgi:hypothetical protein
MLAGMMLARSKQNNEKQSWRRNFGKIRFSMGAGSSVSGTATIPPGTSSGVFRTLRKTYFHVNLLVPVSGSMSPKLISLSKRGRRNCL